MGVYLFLLFQNKVKEPKTKKVPPNVPKKGMKKKIGVFGFNSCKTHIPTGGGRACQYPRPISGNADGHRANAPLITPSTCFLLPRKMWNN